MTAEPRQDSSPAATPARPEGAAAAGPASPGMQPSCTARSGEACPPVAPAIPSAPPRVRGCPHPLGRALLYVAALFFLFLGILGVFIPGLPTTVFILMAAWAAARSSPRLHAWLRRHTLFGPMLRNWEAGGYVSAKAKRMAVLTMLVCVLIMLLVGVPTWALLLASACMASVAIWLWRRPEPPKRVESANAPEPGPPTV